MMEYVLETFSNYLNSGVTLCNDECTQRTYVIENSYTCLILHCYLAVDATFYIKTAIIISQVTEPDKRHLITDLYFHETSRASEIIDKIMECLPSNGDFLFK